LTTQSKRIIILARYNSGRKAIVYIDTPDYRSIGIEIQTDARRPYDSVEDGYLHIDWDRQNEWESLGERYGLVGEKELVREAIREININYFAGVLSIKSNSREMADVHLPRRRTVRQFITECLASRTAGLADMEVWFGTPLKPYSTRNLRLILNNLRHAIRPQTTRYTIVRPLSEAHLGASWQIDGNRDWLQEAEARKGGKLA
jgi:hypothetical protein